MNRRGLPDPIYIWIACGVILALCVRGHLLADSPAAPPVSASGEEGVWEVKIIQSARLEPWFSAKESVSNSLYSRAKILAAFHPEVQSLVGKEVALVVQGSALFWVPEKKLLSGQVWRLRGRFQVPKGFANPGSEDPVLSLHRRGLSGRLHAAKGPLWLVRGETPFGSRLLDRVSTHRERVAERIFAVLDHDQAALVAALLLGYRNGVSPAHNRLFIRGGVAHILAVSGAHVATLLFFTYQAIFFLVRRSRSLSRRVSPDRFCALVNLPVVWAYVFLTGASPSVLRAGLMISLFLVSRLLERGFHALNILGIAAILTLAYDPAYLWSPSWQLSFTAVLSILIGLKRRSGTLRSHGRSWLTAWQTLFWVSFWASLGTLPLVLFHFGQFSLVGLLSNLVVVPLIGLFVMPLLFLSLLWVSAFPGMTLFPEVLWHMAAILLHVSEGILEILLRIPYAYFSIPHVGGWQAVFLGGVVLAAFLVRSLRWRLRIGLILLVTLLGQLAVVHFVGRMERDRFWMEVLDVGHGDAICVHLPGGQVILVDGGGFAYSPFDLSRKIWLPYLRFRGIDRLDALVVTHPHPDHFLGFQGLLGEIPIAEIWSNGDWRGGEIWQEFLEAARLHDIPVRSISEKTRSPLSGAFAMAFLNPTEAPISENVNNHSIVIAIETWGKRILLTGDIERAGERRILDTVSAKPIDVLKVPHHGSLTSSSLPFLQNLSPRWAIVSAGKVGKNGLPHPEIVERYRDLAIPLLTTAACGAIRYEILPSGTERWSHWRESDSGKCALEKEENKDKKPDTGEKDHLQNFLFPFLLVLDLHHPLILEKGGEWGFL